MLQAEAKDITDPLRKQELTLQCRIEQHNLYVASKNCQDIASKLNVVIDFLDDIRSQLTEIDEKLTEIQENVSALREDFRRAAGRPVMEVYAMWKEMELKSSLRSEVYLELVRINLKAKSHFVL